MGLLPGGRPDWGWRCSSSCRPRSAPIAGAATQIVMMMTSLAYMPAVGIAIAGTTLVGQSIGAGDRDWARKMGNSAIKLNVAYMGLVSLALALAGPWLLPLFVTPADPNADAVVQNRRHAAVDRRRLPGVRRGQPRRRLRAARRRRRARAHPAGRAGVMVRLRSADAHAQLRARSRAGCTSCRSSASARSAAGVRCCSTPRRSAR